MILEIFKQGKSICKGLYSTREEMLKDEFKIVDKLKVKYNCEPTLKVGANVSIYTFGKVEYMFVNR